MPENGIAFQEQLVLHSAPTLGNMKLGSLFRIKNDIHNCGECLSFFNQLLNDCDIKLCVLRKNQAGTLIYIYHEKQLFRYIQNPSIQAFLNEYGYNKYTVHDVLNHLRIRLHEKEFPHEIGAFLGYPLYDVKQYISPNKECKYIGYWKVYGNVKNCKKTFYRYNCLRNAMTAKLLNGEPLQDIVKRLHA